MSVWSYLKKIGNLATAIFGLVLIYRAGVEVGGMSNATKKAVADTNTDFNKTVDFDEFLKSVNTK